MTYDISMILSNIYDIVLKLGLFGTLVTIAIYFLNRFNKEKKVKEKYFEFFVKSESLKHEYFNIAEYKEAYWQLKENDIISKLLKNRKNIIVTGKPSAGKTRILYESLKVLKGFKVIKFYSNHLIELEEIPNHFFKKKIIIFLDDLDEYTTKLNLIQLIKKLDLNSEEYMILTCITGNNYDKAEKEFGYLKNYFNEVKIEDINDDLALKISQKYDLNLNDFDGTIGSLFLKFKRMELEFNKEDFPEECRILFRLIKLFDEALIQLITRNTLEKTYLKKIRKEYYKPNYTFETVFEKIKGYGLIIEKNGLIRVMHRNYLKISHYTPSLPELKWLKNILIEIKDENALYGLANAFNYKGEYDEAINCLDTVLEINPLNEGALESKGRSLDGLGMFDEAIECLDEAIKINKKNPSYFYNKGYLLFRLGVFRKSNKLF